ncbi:retroviral-like aspartic protease family protein [Alteromonas sp. C1M14]|nr:retroviral-like aspartic protease family protein [Alteromonas sp. C1M14]
MGVSNAYCADDVTHTFSLSRHSGGTLYVDITLEQGISAPFLVDTGSGLVTLNKKTFDALNRDDALVPVGEVAARMANGRIHAIKQYRLQSLRIGNSCELGPIDVAVLPNGSNILSINALLRAAPMTLSADALTLSGCRTDMLVMEKPAF